MRISDWSSDVCSSDLMVAAVDQRHIVAMVGQVQRLLDRGVAATDHHDLLAAIEEAVAGRAGRDALAAQFLLARNAEPFGLRTCRDHQRFGHIDVRSEEHTSELQSLMRTS